MRLGAWNSEQAACAAKQVLRLLLQLRSVPHTNGPGVERPKCYAMVFRAYSIAVAWNKGVPKQNCRNRMTARHSSKQRVKRQRVPGTHMWCKAT